MTTVYECKFVGLEFQAELQERIVAALQGMEDLTAEVWKIIYETIEKTANKYGEDGWQMKTWSMQPAPHILLERTKTVRRSNNRSKQDA